MELDRFGPSSQQVFFIADPHNPLKEGQPMPESAYIRKRIIHYENGCNIRNYCLGSAPSPKNVLYKITPNKSLSYFKEDL